MEVVTLVLLPGARAPVGGGGGGCAGSVGWWGRWCGGGGGGECGTRRGVGGRRG